MASVTPSKTSGWLVDEEVRALRAAGLLVGEEHDDEVARRHGPGAGDVPHAREDHRVHVLHVDRAPPPDAPVALLRREGVDRPVRGVRRDDVEVAMDAQGSSLPVGAGDAHGDAHAARVALEGLGLQTHLSQLVDDVCRGLRLPRTAPVAVVRRVDPDQLPAELDDLVLGPRHGVGHGQPL